MRERRTAGSIVRSSMFVAVEQNLALGALARIEVVHPVEDAQQGRLAAARGTDHAP